MAFIRFGMQKNYAAQRDILFEDNHCLAICKNAGDLVQGDRSGDPTLADAAKDYLKQTKNKPGNVYLGVLHRLDRPVSGVVLFAKTSKAAARIAEQFRERTIVKKYWTLVEGRPPVDTEGVLIDYMRKDQTRNVSEITREGAGGARRAELSYRVLARRPGRAVLEVKLITGLPHQIRVQLANLGCPVVGDIRYGSNTELGRMLALHHKRITFTHPTRDEKITVEAPIPRELKKLEEELGIPRGKNQHGKARKTGKRKKRT